MDYALYIDEAGCTGPLPHGPSEIQPVFALTGLILPINAIKTATLDAMALKARFNPQVAKKLPHYADLLRFEVKGSNLRKDIATGNRNKRRAAVGYIGKNLELIELVGGKILARILIKEPGVAANTTAIYTSAIQSLCEHFNQLLIEQSANGIIIVDQRLLHLDKQVAFSIFTQKYSAGKDNLSRIVEPPVFGASDNHIGLQLSDLLASAILFPMACHTYCNGHIDNTHLRPGYHRIGEAFSSRIKALQFRYQAQSAHRWRGGITVYDGIEKSRSAKLMFGSQPASTATSSEASELQA